MHIHCSLSLGPWCWGAEDPVTRSANLRSHTPWSKMHIPRGKGPTEEPPSSGWWEMKIKSLGQKAETEQEIELSKRNLV